MKRDKKKWLSTLPIGDVQCFKQIQTNPNKQTNIFSKKKGLITASIISPWFKKKRAPFPAISSRPCLRPGVRWGPPRAWSWRRGGRSARRTRPLGSRRTECGTNCTHTTHRSRSRRSSARWSTWARTSCARSITLYHTPFVSHSTSLLYHSISLAVSHTFSLYHTFSVPYSLFSHIHVSTLMYILSLSLFRDTWNPSLLPDLHSLCSQRIRRNKQHRAVKIIKG